DLAAVLGRVRQAGRQAQRSRETLEQNCADDDGTTTPARLDLTGYRNTTPTDIMKWARKTQRHLFPHLAPLRAKSAAKVADGNRKDLRTLQQVEIDRLKARIAELEEENESLRERGAIIAS